MTLKEMSRYERKPFKYLKYILACIYLLALLCTIVSYNTDFSESISLSLDISTFEIYDLDDPELNSLLLEESPRKQEIED